MKRLWLGIALLLILLLLGIFLQLGMNAIYEPVSTALEQASQAALAENWQEALPLAQSAFRQWSRYQKLTASAADHTPMDEVEMLFAELRTYAKAREGAHFAACCAQLAQMAQSISQAHYFSWWNLL